MVNKDEYIYIYIKRYCTIYFYEHKHHFFVITVMDWSKLNCVPTIANGF